MSALTKSILVALVFQTVVSLTAKAAPDQAAETIFKNLMGATISDDYDAFIAECDATMKAAMTRSLLEGVSKQVGPRSAMGYDPEYLGELRQHGFAVHLWRLRFKDGGDDLLATVSIKDGKAGGFYLH